MDFTVRNIRKIMGSIFHLLTADVELNGDQRFSVTYDLDKQNVIVSEWYKLQSDVLDALRMELKDFFAKTLAA